MIFYILNRDMDVVASMSNDTTGTMYINDSSGGQTITMTNGCAIGSYDFTTDPYHKDSVYIKAGNFIAFNDKYNRTRLYTIMTVQGDDELDVHCEDIGLDLINEMANAWDYDIDQTLDFYLNQVLGTSSWTVQYDSTGLSAQTRHLNFNNNTDTKLKRLESIMAGFGFECDFEVKIELMRVTKMVLHVYEKLQNRTEYDIKQRFVDSINLVSLNRSESITDLYTAVLPTGGTVDGKAIDISSIDYDDGQYWTTKGDDKLYDRLAAEKWNRFSGTSDQDVKGYKYIYGHYSSSTTSVGTLFDEALTNLKEHHDVKLAYEAKLLDLDVDLGDWITIVDHAKQEKVYLKARVQEVTNYYTVPDEDTGVLANYQIMSSKNGDTIRDLLNQIEAKVSKVKETKLYYQLSTNGMYPPSNEDWSETAPNIPDGYWLWVKCVTIYYDDTQVITYSCTQTNGIYKNPASVVKRTKLYFLSTSKTTPLKSDGTAPTDDDWSEEQPSYVGGMYCFSRERVEWTDGTIEYTFPTYEQWSTDAQENANEANSNANSAQNSANNAQNSADSAQNKADQADKNADDAHEKINEVSEAAKLAYRQAQEAQAAADDANRLAQNAWQGVSDLEQVVIADQRGLIVKQAANATNYSQIQSDGMHVFNNNNEVAKFGMESHINNLAVSDFMMFGAHRAELLTIQGEQCTAFYWIGDVQ